MRTPNTAKTTYIQRRMATQHFGYFLRAVMISIGKNYDFGIAKPKVTGQKKLYQLYNFLCYDINCDMCNTLSD